MKLKNKLNRVKFILKKYNFFYIFGCFFRKIILSFILLERNLYIDRGVYRLHYRNEPFIHDLFINPKMIREDETFIKKFLKEGDIYIDIGANIGTTTLCASKISGNTGKVFAFEPHIETFLFLKKNIILNKVKNVKLYNLALGDKEEKLFITDEEASDINHLVKDGDISVDVKTLDSVLDELDKVSLLKVDVEGFEEAVFKGANKVLEKTEVVFFESSKKQYDRYGFSFDNIFKLLTLKGFKIYHTSFSNDRIIFREIVEAGYFSEGVENICASKKTLPESVSF